MNVRALELDHVLVLYDIYEATKELDADTRLKILEAACIQLEQLEKEEKAWESGQKRK